jgi:hypothetical protein
MTIVNINITPPIPRRHNPINLLETHKTTIHIIRLVINHIHTSGTRIPPMRPNPVHRLILGRTTRVPVELAVRILFQSERGYCFGEGGEQVETDAVEGDDVFAVAVEIGVCAEMGRVLDPFSGGEVGMGKTAGVGEKVGPALME